MKSEPSILVVGAGPVGMTAAIELQRRGFHPRVIDRAKEPAGESRALVIHARSLEIFEPSGVAEKLLDAGHEVQAMVLATADRELARLQFTHSRQRFNYLLLLPQQETERILLSHLQERGIEIEWQTELSELKQTEMGVECRVRGEEISTYELVIGTDGARSTVRECLGIDFTGSSYEHDWTLADIRFRETRPVNEGRVKVLDGAKITYFPFTPNFGRFIYSGQDGMRFFAEEVQVEEVVWESSFRISHRIVESYQRGNVFLAGDAAHVHSPVGGRGMNLGIEDAATLAWLIEKGATDQYNALRQPLGRRVLRLTDIQTRQAISRNGFTRFMMRRVAPWLLKSKTVQRVAFRQLSGANTPRPAWLSSR